MEKKKVDLGAVAAEAGKNAKAFWGKAKETIVNVADQNDDGSLDLKDISVVAGSIGNAAKETATSMILSAGEKHRELERKLLQPIFVEDLNNADFLISKLVRITEIDKRHAESEVCKDSIGFISDQKDLKVVNIYKDTLRYLLIEYPYLMKMRKCNHFLIFMPIDSILVVVNPSCIKPIHGFQICIIGRIADANDGIGFCIFGQAKEFCQCSLSTKLRVDFRFTFASTCCFL